MTNVIEDQLLKSNFSTADYAQIEGELNSITDHVNNLCRYIKENVLPYVNKRFFLDIGAGPGFITRKLLGHFDRAIALDPNNYYASYYSDFAVQDKLRFVNNNFEVVDFTHVFDFILCSHVLYHVPQKQWPTFIQKVLKLLAKKGRSLFTLIATSGRFHDLCEQINHNYSNSQVLKSALIEMEIPYTVTKVISPYSHKDAERLIKLLRIFVIDDCFLPEEYVKLSDSKIKAIDQSIMKFLEDCYDHEKNLYSFQIEEDYIQLHAD